MKLQLSLDEATHCVRIAHELAYETEIEITGTSPEPVTLDTVAAAAGNKIALTKLVRSVCQDLLESHILVQRQECPGCTLYSAKLYVEKYFNI